jgi:hypothetical protein
MCGNVWGGNRNRIGRSDVAQRRPQYRASSGSGIGRVNYWQKRVIIDEEDLGVVGLPSRSSHPTQWIARAVASAQSRDQEHDLHRPRRASRQHGADAGIPEYANIASRAAHSVAHGIRTPCGGSYPNCKLSRARAKELWRRPRPTTDDESGFRFTAQLRSWGNPILVPHGTST